MSSLPSDPPRSRWRSLRGKGFIGTLALVVYLIGTGLYVAGERAAVDSSFRQLETVSSHEKALALAESAVGGALLDVSTMGPASSAATPVPLEIQLYMENCSKLFKDLDGFDPGYARLQRTIQRSYEAVQADGSRAAWLELREALTRVAADLEIRHDALLAERESLGAAYRRHYDAVTVETLGLALVGLVIFGSLAAWFVTGLAWDVQRLEAHAWRVVRGVRGTQLRVERRDELGDLMHAVNRMAVDLDEREKQIELDAERRSHEEKMLSVAAVAAGVAHEVNNPLTVISALAQELQAGARGPSPEAVAAAAQQILTQVDRAARASRQLADVAAPQPDEFGWVDLNSLVRRAVQLMGYDRRYRGTRIVLDLHEGLPAVHTSASAVQLVLMQLLALGCEAATRGGDAAAELRVRSSASSGSVCIEMDAPAELEVAVAAPDDTPGMADSSPGGRGLTLVRATLDAIGGRIALEQVADGTQRVQCSFPEAAVERIRAS